MSKINGFNYVDLLIDEIVPFESLDKIPRFKRARSHRSTCPNIRYDTFVAKGTTCVYCGASVTKVIRARPRVDYRVDRNKPVYVLMCDNNSVLTADHILPKSLGGTHSVENYAPCCFNCNNKKGNHG